MQCGEFVFFSVDSSALALNYSTPFANSAAAMSGVQNTAMPPSDTTSISKENSEGNILEHAHAQPIPKWRAWTLLVIFSMAQLLDIFNVTAPTIALPDVASDLGFNFAQRQWAINAYSLTFGAFLLTVS